MSLRNTENYANILVAQIQRHSKPPVKTYCLSPRLKKLAQCQRHLYQIYPCLIVTYNWRDNDSYELEITMSQPQHWYCCLNPITDKTMSHPYHIHNIQKKVLMSLCINIGMSQPCSNPHQSPTVNITLSQHIFFQSHNYVSTNTDITMSQHKLIHNP